MLRTPRFSIIVPVFNAKAYLAEALLTVQRQMFQNWECICVDDGSVDGSRDILDSIQEGDDRFRVVHQSNSGASVARNTGLSLAKGDYVCFLDADDTVDADWLETYARCLAEHPVDVVRVKRPWWHVAPGLVTESRLTEWCWQEWVREGYPWTYAVRREIAIKAKFPVGVWMSEDQLFAARLVPCIRAAYQLECCGYNHRVYAGSAMSRPLPSSERLAYLKAVESLAQDHVAPREEIARMTATAIVTWLNRWSDSSRASEIRTVWKNLAARGLARPVGLSALYRFPYAVYSHTGWLMPGRIWAAGVRSGVAVKKVLKRVCGT